MAELVLEGDPPLSVTLRRHASARRLTLRLSSLDGRVTLTAPPYVGNAEVEAFAREREAWLRDKLAGFTGAESVGDGTVLPVEGRDTLIRLVPRARPAIGPEEIVAGSARAVEAVLRQRARDRLAGAVDRYTAVLGRPAQAISLRDPRSRWGSCSSAGRLMFSWRLILAPAEVLDYVAAHEVAHLRHMNHSSAFWETVGELLPDHKRSRAWLRREGAALHRWRFGD